MGGPLKIAKYSGEQFQRGWLDFVGFAALISINLAFINLLPIPGLDGGHLALYAAEGIRRRPLGPRSQEWAFRTGLALVLGLMLFVTLNDLHVEGLVHITELGGEYFRFDEVRQELRGERTGIRYIIGSKVRVQVSRVDLDGRKIDFRMVSDNDEIPARTPRERPGSGAAEGRSGKTAKSAKTGGRAARPPRPDGEGPSRQAMSPIQALKASVKKVAGRAKKSSKPRNSRR